MVPVLLRDDVIALRRRFYETFERADKRPLGKLFASSGVVPHRNANSAACRREVLIEIFKTQPANRDGYLLVVVTEPVVPVGGSDAVEKDVAGQVPGALDVAVPVEEDWAATRVASSGSCSKAVVPVGGVRTRPQVQVRVQPQAGVDEYRLVAAAKEDHVARPIESV